MADAPITGRAAVYKKSFDSPDETRTFGKGKAEIAEIGGASIFRLYYEPGWKWSEHIKPMAKTDRCEVAARRLHGPGTLEGRRSGWLGG
jgi:hypothetical protein